MPSRRRVDWLADIVDNCNRISRHIAGMTSESYVADEKTSDAVERCLQRICEAATRLKHHERANELDHTLDELYPQVPWDDVRGMGDILRHKYDLLDDDIIWVTITEKLNPLRDAASQEMARLQEIARLKGL